ncbi:hypothetical protein EVB97_094 [Rhizobium phage RHph_Y65]|uniref:Uncharacterized protein n=1 Tax=Rhizobium phage RHph_Y65 TaxID=2509785 RepID=A0A7S5R7Y8_9CAUD|nr:hypothetical protein PQC17_gp094 [Rhizobium phage RHph_Y65]QIG72652.1 hypothetical protein EVB97_094 [Rhizobium phage RHph_Y65]
MWSDWFHLIPKQTLGEEIRRKILLVGFILSLTLPWIYGAYTFYRDYVQ